MATVIHILAERGLIDYDQPIAHYWPGFAAHGKEKITVRHGLSHTSGIPYMPEGIGHAELCDWNFMCRAIAQLKPVWPAGEQMRYHPVTYAWIVGEVARIVTGRPVQSIIEAEICQPLAIKRMFCGVPAELEPNVAFLEDVPETPVAEPPPPGNPAEQDIAPCMQPLYEWMNRTDARMACNPASNGVMSARAIARHYAALLPGGVDGVELLPQARVTLATEQQFPTTGYEEGVSPRKGLGYGLRECGFPGSFGHAGFGGSIGFADPDHRLAVGITRNLYGKHDLMGAIAKEIRDSSALRRSIEMEVVRLTGALPETPKSGKVRTTPPPFRPYSSNG